MPFDLFAWWNAIYSVPLAFVLLVLTITSVVSLIGAALGELGEAHGEVAGHHDAGVDADVDADVDLDVDVDTDMDADLEVDHQVNVGHYHADGTFHAHAHNGGGIGKVFPALPDGAHHQDADHGPVMAALLILGVGKAPLLMVLQVLLLLWGSIGVILHQSLKVSGPGALAWSIPLTLVLSVIGTRSLAYTVGRFFKSFETSAVKRDQIVGRTGTVVYAVNDNEGTISVRDQHGTLHRVRARSHVGELDSGQQIIVIGYDPESRIYNVDDAVRFVERP